MTPRSRHVALATGVNYHLLEWGDPDSELTVVLIHGFLDLAWGWQETCRHGLADRFHVVAPDMRGHGDSDRIGAGGYYHFADYIADLASLVEQLPDNKLAIVGHSMGGSIASYYAGAFPDRVQKLALLEGMGPPELPIDAPARVVNWVAGWRKARARSPKIYPDIEAAAARLKKHDARLDDALALELAERGTRAKDGGREFKHDPLHLTMGPYAFRLAHAEAFWSRIKCPVLAVDAAESEMTLPADERERRYSNIANLQREVIADAGHMLQRHRPAELAALLLEFLRDTVDR